MDVIKVADWIIDIGPDGGIKGGEIVFAGVPEELAKRQDNFTGIFLKEELEASKKAKDKTQKKSLK